MYALRPLQTAFLKYMYFVVIVNGQKDCCSGVTVLRAAGTSDATMIVRPGFSPIVNL